MCAGGGHVGVNEGLAEGGPLHQRVQSREVRVTYSVFMLFPATKCRQLQYYGYHWNNTDMSDKRQVRNGTPGKS
jgi:hypothetical protein